MNVNNRGTLLALVATGFLVACGPPPREGNAILRGDEAFARGEFEEALAEYQLALLRGSTAAEVHARVAHTFAQMGRVNEVAEHYREALARDSSYADQAVGDLVRIARDAAVRRDLFGVAAAVEEAARFRPGVSMNDLALPLAQHYKETGEFERALPYFQTALAAAHPDSAGELLYETALAYEEVGDCSHAIIYLSRYRDLLPGVRRTEVDWHLGFCSFHYGRSLHQDGFGEEALRNIEKMIELGEPKQLLPQAYFEKAEILSGMGVCDAAREAYQRILATDLSESDPLVTRARLRLDEMIFGIRAGQQQPDGGC